MARRVKSATSIPSEVLTEFLCKRLVGLRYEAAIDLLTHEKFYFEAVLSSQRIVFKEQGTTQEIKLELEEIEA